MQHSDTFQLIDTTHTNDGRDTYHRHDTYEPRNTNNPKDMPRMNQETQHVPTLEMTRTKRRNMYELIDATCMRHVPTKQMTRTNLHVTCTNFTMTTYRRQHLRHDRLSPPTFTTRPPIAANIYDTTAYRRQHLRHDRLSLPTFTTAVSLNVYYH
jgi:hypothetical protein